MPVRFPDGTAQAPHLQKFDGRAPHESRKAFHGGRTWRLQGDRKWLDGSRAPRRAPGSKPATKKARANRERKKTGGRVRGIAPLAGACPPRKASEGGGRPAPRGSPSRPDRASRCPAGSRRARYQAIQILHASPALWPTPNYPASTSGLSARGFHRACCLARLEAISSALWNLVSEPSCRPVSPTKMAIGACLLGNNGAAIRDLFQ